MDKFYKYLLFAFVYLGTCHVNMAQSKVAGLDKELLMGRSYNEIELLEDEAYSGDRLDLLRKYSDIHVMKAKREDNEVQIGRGYYYRTIIEDTPLALAYSDSIILATMKSSDPDYPTLGFIQKGEILFNVGNFQLALDNYLEAYNLSLEKQNLGDQRLTTEAIAAIRNINGQPHIAADLYRRSLELLKLERDYGTVHYKEYIMLLYNLSLAHLRLFQLDSATYYSGIGMNKSLLSKDTLEYMDFVFVDGEINYFKGNYQKARDSILKYVDRVVGTERAIKLYYLGKIELQAGNNEEAVKYYLKIDSIVAMTDDPFDELKDVYQQLVMESNLKGNGEMQIYYIGKLMHYDSVLSSKQKGIAQRATIAYDIPFLKLQKQIAESRLEHKNRWNKVLGIIAMLAVLLGIIFYLRARIINRRIRNLLDGPKITSASDTIINAHSTSVPRNIRQDILQKLKEFENSERFLGKEIDLPSLAQELGTNTMYLSTLINHYKKMSFPNYLKDLRITAAINGLSENSDLLKYNYQGLADIFGFKTVESFSKTFYQKTGVYPSKFLKELGARKKSDHL
ncbi:helix-turn-helix domain-containing protein [Flavobacteriaceae bacterium F89]|uniref:Helix-turn-helix domain-containing protein n=1 Tax=Cerina litoralis TaxID=2874477 RepID=A0AAE3EUT5_9FLAO|nr:helix-turn-helix domain-containing protein [Cerina litoralis]MCG2460524.1 helix-turn-helix domain-containing protein [Cerina litoralis]